MQKRFQLLTATLLLCLGLLAVPALAQHEHHGQQPTGDKKNDAATMLQEPHHVLAEAYLQTVNVFSKALHQQSLQASSLNGDFARDVVSEIRRAFDLVERHRQDHAKTMSGSDAHAGHASAMKQAHTHTTKVRELLALLERETSGTTLQAKRIAELSQELLGHLSAMSGSGETTGEHIHKEE